MRDSAKSDEEFFSSLDELSTSLRHLRSSKRCKCVVVGMDYHLQLPGDVDGLTEKGIWRHDFDERMAGRVDAVMKLLVKRELSVVFHI